MGWNAVAVGIGMKWGIMWREKYGKKRKWNGMASGLLTEKWSFGS